MKAELKTDCLKKIERLARFLLDHPEIEVGLDGHGDLVATDEREVPMLAERRVRTVRAALVEAGVEPGRILVGAFGAHRGVCLEATDSCRALNRRVEVLAIRRLAH